MKKKLKAIIFPVLQEDSKLKGDKVAISFLKDIKKKELFKGEAGEQFIYYNTEKEEEWLFLGLGKKDKLITKKALELSGGAARTLTSKNRDFSLHILEEKLSKDILNSLIEGFYIGQYSFKTHKSDKKDKKVYCDKVEGNIEKADVKEALALAEATVIAREISNEPSNIIYPETLAKKVEKLGKKYGFEVEVIGEKKIKELGMESYLSVARGSDKEPKLIVMRYMNDKKSKEILGYVGKGITYDSGGYSIKPTSGMVTMNLDMAGGAAVLSAMTVIARMKLKLNVVGVIAACENLINGSAYKPGDIIQSMGGKSIFIGNTDAEGRLTLIDGVYYAKTVEKATKIVDIATLTGAAIYTVGSVATSSISTDDKFFASMEKAYELGSERIHRLPIYEEYDELLKHPFADLTNTAGNPGTITAGYFVAQFAEGVPFTHLDIAATCRSERDKGVYSEGATGSGTRPLYYLAKVLSEK